ncbi:tRNA lysidine(34) synthetase TilS [Aliifodinibius salicampi]|uniref:tRNA(Ile)-lysidine synthase n=1 Tax=Fodinibius salicampi TaxID=1920655 RepID=A0ABT3Q2X2_9BACT|nr:tRNA lysidine(34) synthetase TilS [Fodinibius salicampi]MCW9714470.1 tRNA lysidine(34) synthetase TilS [Fodinibius salicampi]
MSKSELSPIEETVEQNVTTTFGKKKTPSFILGVSGGMDSMCLLYIFKKLGISTFVVHVNYKKRGRASEKDEQLVVDTARKWGIDCTTFEVEPKEGEGYNFQQWARNKRYEHFEEVLERKKADGIAVAHHRDDQIETILQKIFRGGGLASWSGMEVWDGRVFRPLLTVSREEIKTYVEKNAISYRTDESNLTSDFARNLLRNEWLTELSNFFPGWKKNVLRIRKQAGCFEYALQWIADKVTDENGIIRKQFQSLEEDLQKSLLLHLLKKEEEGIEVTNHSLSQIEKLETLQTGKTIQLTADYLLLRDREYYRLISGGPEEKKVIETLSRSRVASNYRYNKLLLTISECTFSEELFNDKTLFMDVDKISWPVTLRHWWHGDQFKPLGMQGHQSVADHLTNRKISAARKRDAFVIESFEETICAVIFPPIKKRIKIGTISEEVKCEVNTGKCLEIKYSQ